MFPKNYSQLGTWAFPVNYIKQLLFSQRNVIHMIINWDFDKKTEVYILTKHMQVHSYNIIVIKDACMCKIPYKRCIKRSEDLEIVWSSSRVQCGFVVHGGVRACVHVLITFFSPRYPHTVPHNKIIYIHTHYIKCSITMTDRANQQKQLIACRGFFVGRSN